MSTDQPHYLGPHTGTFQPPHYTPGLIQPIRQVMERIMSKDQADLLQSELAKQAPATPPLAPDSDTERLLAEAGKVTAMDRAGTLVYRLAAKVLELQTECARRHPPLEGEARSRLLAAIGAEHVDAAIAKVRELQAERESWKQIAELNASEARRHLRALSAHQPAKEA